MNTDNNQPPNIIFILVDDLGWRDVGSYGSTFYETPNLDRLAAEGMIFSDAYAACPVCSPTRASILTGKYPATLGLTDWIDWNGTTHPARGKLVDVPYIDHLPLSENSLAQALNEGGYHTWHVGKWHLGSEDYYPEHHGFEINIAGCEWGFPMKGYFSPYDVRSLENGPPGEYLTDRLTDEAIKVIESQPERPFFLNLWYYSVHTPIQAKAQHIEHFEGKAQDLGLDALDPFEVGESFPTEHKQHLRVTRRKVQSDPVYAAMVYALDENVGRLLESLERTGQLDNTIVIFTSENGGLATAEGSPTCNAPLSEGKGWMYEGGTREPLIVYWPGVCEPNSVCRVPVTSPDFYPTLIEMAGLPFRPEQHLDGVSILSLLKGADSLEREAIFWHYPHYGNQGGTPGSAIRIGDHKLIHFYEDDRLEMYNLNEDLSESHNLVGQMPGLAADLKMRLEAWCESIEAKIPQPNPTFEQQ